MRITFPKPLIIFSDDPLVLFFFHYTYFGNHYNPHWSHCPFSQSTSNQAWRIYKMIPDNNWGPSRVSSVSEFKIWHTFPHHWTLLQKHKEVISTQRGHIIFLSGVSGRFVEPIYSFRPGLLGRMLNSWNDDVLTETWHGHFLCHRDMIYLLWI